MNRFISTNKKFYISIGLLALLTNALISCADGTSTTNEASTQVKIASTTTENVDSSKNIQPPGTYDTARYDRLVKYLANGDSSGRWPVVPVYPKAGAIFPFNRVIAYYGNLFSTRMGILGELPEDEMLNKLKGEVDKWNKADTVIKSIPALHYIAITAQGSPGKEGKYLLRMPFAQIDTILRMAKKIDALVFIDLQIGLSSLQYELPMLKEYLKLPNLHLGIDPEFSMKTGSKPGSRIGSYNAADINYASNYLADLVKEYDIPPKILVIHRFTKAMVQNYKDIKLRPEVQIVLDMDGWGYKAKKLSTYEWFINREPVQFAGFKIFYKNDTKTDPREMQPDDVMQLTPIPIYIQYQ